MSNIKSSTGVAASAITTITPGVLHLIYDVSLRFHIFLKRFELTFEVVQKICDSEEEIISQKKYGVQFITC